jgi:hypothetical protein
VTALGTLDVSWGLIQMFGYRVLGRMAVLAALMFGGAGSSHATVIYGTGEDVSSGVDQAWSVIPFSVQTALADFKYLNPPNAYVVKDNNKFPFGFWAAPLSNSNWITPIKPSQDQALTSPGAKGLDQTSNGFFLYWQTFQSTAAGSLVGQFMADNDVTKISLYDETTSKFISVSYSGAGSDSSPTPFSAPLLANNKYVLAFEVENFAQMTGNPSGLDVQLNTISEARVGAVPEVSTWAMMIVGFLGVGLLAYRRNGSFSVRMA